MDVLTFISKLYCHRLEIRFYAEDDIFMKHWFGAVLRNGFLSMSAEVSDSNSVSLWKYIQTISIPAEHPYYNQLRGGFPKGFFFDCSSIEGDGKGFSLKKNQIQHISLYLIGNFSCHYLLCIESLCDLFKRGIGHPIVPLHILDVTEIGPNKEKNLLYSDATPIKSKLCYPIQLDNQMQIPTSQSLSVELFFDTPICLYHPKIKKIGLGYQDKLNGFPSFYQLIRSAVYRMVTLTMLYTNHEMEVDKCELETEIEKYIYSASEAILTKAILTYCKLYSTPKMEEGSVYVLNGYMGQLNFANVNVEYLSVMQFASHLNVGNDINYGLGTFSIRVANKNYK